MKCCSKPDSVIGNIPRIGDYIIVRTYSAGVFAGTLVYDGDNQIVILLNARRLWYIDGAASLSQLAMEGVKRPESCKFPCEVTSVKLFEVTEILSTTKQAEKSIKNVPIWECNE